MTKQIVEPLKSRLLLSASLIQDVDLRQYSSDVNTLGTIGTQVIFAEDDGTHGLELYRSDGTSGGTFLLKDIQPGPKGSNPTFLATVGDTLFFSAGDGISTSLWKTDGSVDGTVKLNGTLPAQRGVAVLGNVLFYVGHENKLWRTD